ncbi:MAG TPA: hypothetical protein VFB84_19515 [Micromonosporaceae bacterium]|nr:hypothetical protein [Micromonosporaceae bacterium]
MTDRKQKPRAQQEQTLEGCERLVAGHERRLVEREHAADRRDRAADERETLANDGRRSPTPASAGSSNGRRSSMSAAAVCV